MIKQVLVGDSAKIAIAQALDVIADAVGSTIGPGGMPFGFDKMNLDGNITTMFTKDGLTVLKSLHFDRPSHQAVLQYCKQASSHSVLASGDGPQPLYSKVLTPNGFIDMGDVKVGMKICGTDGTIQEVLGIFQKGEREVYKIEFSNERSVECCGDHLWKVTNTETSDNREEIKTTLELSKDYLRYKSNGDLQRKYYTPRSVVEFNTNISEMPLDPYLVGVLLGDGSLSGTDSIELSLGFKKEHIINKLILPDGFHLTINRNENKHEIRIKIKGKNKQGQTIKDVAESIGLLGTRSATKFIPKSYLYTSIYNREQLLRGLLDTDGHINNRDLFEFSSVSKELTDDFVELCRSLGKTVSFYKLERKEGESYSMTPIYRVQQLKGYKFGDRIDKITATGTSTTMQCIKVSNPDSLYITDNYITTHNTTSTIVLANAIAREIANCRTKVPQELSRQIEREADRAIDEIRKEAIKTSMVVEKVALTSTNGDNELAKVVLDAIGHTGAHSSILVEKNPASPVRYRILRQDGYSYCRGYDYNQTLALSAHPDAAASKAFDWDNPAVLIFNGSLFVEDQIKPILSVWNKVLQETPKNLVIVAFDNSDEVANKLLVVNRTLAKHGVAAIIVKPRLTAEINSGLQVLRDMAAFCGVDDTKIVDGGNFKEIDESYFGTCGKARIGSALTMFLGRSKDHWVEKRILQNQSIITEARSQFDREITTLRNAELAEGLVKVEVGGGLLPDLQERADRFDDASKAAKSCMLHGALPGGGLSYIRAGLIANVSKELMTALASVHQKVLSNYGSTVAVSVDGKTGFKLTSTGVEFGDAVELGVLDACETICAVIKNGIGLGTKLAILGGFSYRPVMPSDIE